MLAVCTYSSLVLLDPPTLKRPPPTVSPKCTLPSPPTASTWAPDNSALFIAHDNSIRSFDPSGTPRKTLEREHPVVALACKDNGNTIIYSSHDQIIVLDAATGAVASTLDTHSEPVTGLALSNDASLLASISRTSDNGPGAVHVHNLSSASHTVLQGLPSPGTVTACVFHTHTKTKLLLGVDGQLVIYDVTKPNAPLKTVIVEKIPSEVVAITCSPFSKTLVAVGCASGSVHLVDLEKEKGLFRTLPLHAPLTSLVFSPEGAALCAGTENGKVLILDLRALDKPPKSIDISSEGQRVMCMAIQRKLKPGERTTSSATGLSKRRVGADTTNLSAESKAASLKSKTSNPKLNAMMSPRFSRTRTISTTASTPAKPSSTLKVDPTKSTPPTPRVSPKPPVPAPMRIRTTSSGTSVSSRVTSASSTVSRSTKLSSATSVTSAGISSPVSRKATIGARKTHIPPKSPLGDNGDTDATTRPFPSSKRSTSPGREGNAARSSNRANVPRIRTTSAATSRSTASSRVPSGSGPARSTLSTTATLSPSSKPRTRTTTSKAPAAESQPQPGPSSHPLQFTSPSNTALSLSPIPPVPALPAEFRDGEQLTEINIRWDARTPSPVQDDDEEPPDTPLLARMQGKGKQKEVENLRPKTNVLGLGTPELKRWIEAEGPPEAKWEERKIAMVQEPVNDVQIERIEVVGEDDAGGDGSVDDAKPALETHADRTVRMTVQISPRRPLLNPLAGWAPARSPLNPAAHMPDGSSESTPANPAHDIFQSLIRDAMYDFRRETKAEIIGLHLDLVRMGRSWREEMREAFDKWGEELNEVRRENELLRQENESLRRGY